MVPCAGKLSFYISSSRELKISHEFDVWILRLIMHVLLCRTYGLINGWIGMGEEEEKEQRSRLFGFIYGRHAIWCGHVTVNCCCTVHCCAGLKRFVWPSYYYYYYTVSAHNGGDRSLVVRGVVSYNTYTFSCRNAKIIIIKREAVVHMGHKKRYY